MNAIELTRVTLALSGRVVLEHASFAIGEREFIGLLGPNGAGKTTLLRAVLGLVPPASGTIRVFGRPPTRGNAAIGYLPQAQGRITGPHIRGFDFVAAAARGSELGLPLLDAAARREIKRVLEMVGVERLAARPLAQMSGGERQRLLLAQALLGRPRLLLLDEPLISLDPHRQRATVALVRSLQRELGIAVVFSAHEINPLLGALDRVLYLGHHQAALGSVDDVITGPVLSRLYAMPIEVVRLHGRIFVLADGQDVERAEHRHDGSRHA